MAKTTTIALLASLAFACAGTRYYAGTAYLPHRNSTGWSRHGDYSGTVEDSWIAGVGVSWSPKSDSSRPAERVPVAAPDSPAPQPAPVPEPRWWQSEEFLAWIERVLVLALGVAGGKYAHKIGKKKA